MSLSEIEKKIEGKEIKSVEDARKYLTDEEILYYMENNIFWGLCTGIEDEDVCVVAEILRILGGKRYSVRPGFFRLVKRLLKESRNSGFRKARSDAFELLTGGETIETIQKKTAKAKQHTLLYRQSD